MQQLTDNKSLLSLLPNNYKPILMKYINYKNNQLKLIEEKKKSTHSFYVPSRTFKTTYMLLPPYEIRQNGQYYYCVK